MKINVNVELDWVHEDESIDEAIRCRVVSEVSKKVIAMVDKEKQEAMASVINEKINSQINDMLSGFLEKGFQDYDQWGDPKGEPVKIIDMLKSKLENYFLRSR